MVSNKPGIRNLEVRKIKTPEPKRNEVLIRVVAAGVNPVDYYVIGESNLTPSPHIAGSEFAGVVEKIGPNVKRVERGDRVSVYSWLFDSKCDMCTSGNEMMCDGGGMIGENSNGGYAEYSAVPEQNVFKLPDNTSWEVGASLGIAALTPYHAIKEADLKRNETLVVYGASGNTGMFAVQFGRMRKANVIAVSSRGWLKKLGAEYLIGREKNQNAIKRLTSGRMADVVLNSLGPAMWQDSLNILGKKGRLVTFGGWINVDGKGTGFVVPINMQSIYGRHAKIIGTTGGPLKDFSSLVRQSAKLRVKTWKKFKLEDGAEALQRLYSEKRDGRIFIVS